MAVTLSNQRLEQTLDDAYLVATSDAALPTLWIDRAKKLEDSPSVGFIAAVGAVLLAKATDSRIDAFVIQKQEGSAGAYSLRKPATVLAQRRRAYGYDIGSSSDRDPINQGTIVSSRRWDVALGRITPSHKPFLEVILQWLRDVNQLSEQEATEALAAFIRVRREVAPGAAVEQVPSTLAQPPALTDLIEVLEPFAASNPEDGARGMALVAAAYRSAGFQADVPSRNDPRRIDVPIKRGKELVIATEVKQLPTDEVTADTLAADAANHGVRRALLAVLRPGTLAGVDRAGAIRRAEHEHGVVLRIADGTRELLHEAAMAGTGVALNDFCAALPHAYAEALSDIRTKKETIDTWAAIAQRWVEPLV
jgi:hypothetical protein